MVLVAAARRLPLLSLSLLCFQGVTAAAVAVRAPMTVTPATHPVTNASVFFQLFPGSSCYFNDYEEGPDWIYTRLSGSPSAEACAAECMSYDGCTGFELSSTYCSLWFGGACTHEDMSVSLSNPEDMATAVLMDGVARFTDRYCIWTADFVEGVDYVQYPQAVSWNECLSSCVDSTTPGTTSATTTATTAAPDNNDGSNETSGVAALSTVAAAATPAAAPAAVAFSTADNGTNVTTTLPPATTTTMAAAAAVDRGACTGIEAVYSTLLSSTRESCAHYFHGACPPDKMGAPSSLTYDTARLYSLGAEGNNNNGNNNNGNNNRTGGGGGIEAEMSATVDLGDDGDGDGEPYQYQYRVETVHTAARSPEVALNAGCVRDRRAHHSMHACMHACMRGGCIIKRRRVLSSFLLSRTCAQG